MSEPLLSIRHLGKTYGNGFKALTDLSFEVKKGEFLVVIGLSGSGKSTLLRCLNRLHDPSSGEIWFQGRRVDQSSGADVLRLRSDLAMVFQHFNLIPRQSVLTNVLMGRLGSTPTVASLLGLFATGDRAEALECLNLVGIGNKASLRADRLSGGEQQRVAIARALCQKPKVLLADEPVASLDPATCHVIMDYLRKINQELGLTIVCSLHFLSLVREYATRVIAIKEGSLIFEGDPCAITPEWFKKIYGADAREVGTQ